ncbi:tyrosine-type recombinase/integrase [Bacillus licheniformis]|uniref:tyrosine-type recombinase/integrase n=2 Tax=Bacillus licheniformis TaxID=1402 RepID=UPI0004749F38|nr:site-specific integrase [Bacillus licheniformis]KJH55806.1 integrase [Bacillus licheniformis]MED0713054.1 site-specific integrase [Bacillus licheniformis]MED0791047.1 site-specific integrase [Bacillus licheniformis]
MAHYQQRGKNSWLLVVETGYNPIKKKRERFTKTIRVEEALLKTKRKLKNHLDDQLYKFKIEVEAGEYIKPEKTTFESFAIKYEEKILFKKYEYRTSEMHLSHLKNYILPALGHLQLDQIRTMHIVDFMDSLEVDGIRKDGKAGGLADSTRRDIFNVLKAMFNVAFKQWKLINANPMDGLTPPTIRKKEMKYFDSVEAKKFIAALYKIDIKWRLYFLGAMIGGFRRGEGTAFEWHLDVNWSKGGFWVNRSIPKTLNGNPLIKDPKSWSSKRFVKMPDFYMEELASYYRIWQKEKELLGDAWEGAENQYIFHSGKGKPYYYTTPTSKWSKFKKKYKLKDIRLHDLRHTMVALLIEAGENLSAIQKRAGHSSHQITSDIYGHVTEKLENETVEYFNQFNPKNIGIDQ